MSDWKKPLKARKVVLVKGRVRWFYHVVAANGQIITTSQHRYFRKGNARRAARIEAAIYECEVVEPV